MSTILVSILLGAVIPLSIGFTTFLLMRRIVVGDPQKMMKANVIGFLLRMFLYGIVIVLVLTTMELDLIGFITAFASVFILLHLAEALYFRRLILSQNL